MGKLQKVAGYKHDRNPDLNHHLNMVRLIAGRAASWIGDGETMESMLGTAARECLLILKSYDPKIARVSTTLMRWGLTRTMKAHFGEGGLTRKRMVNGKEKWVRTPLAHAIKGDKGFTDSVTGKTFTRIDLAEAPPMEEERELALSPEECSYLTQDEWACVRLQYQQNKLTLDEIALSISAGSDNKPKTREWIRQIRNRAIVKLMAYHGVMFDEEEPQSVDTQEIRRLRKFDRATCHAECAA